MPPAWVYPECITLGSIIFDSSNSNHQVLVSYRIRVVPTYHQDEDDQDAHAIQDDNPAITKLIHVEYSTDENAKTETPMVIEEDEKLMVFTSTKVHELLMENKSIDPKEATIPCTRQPQVPARRKPTLTEAVTYIHGVNETFRETPYKYQMFLDVIKEYGVRRDVAVVISKITDLFEGHEDLLFGFNAFLPDPYIIDVPRI
ncbi:paired amphipathic helix protein Sin3-like protein 2 [Tanacetum coccineum]